MILKLRGLQGTTAITTTSRPRPRPRRRGQRRRPSRKRHNATATTAMPHHDYHDDGDNDEHDCYYNLSCLAYARRNPLLTFVTHMLSDISEAADVHSQTKHLRRGIGRNEPLDPIESCRDIRQRKPLLSSGMRTQAEYTM